MAVEVLMKTMFPEVAVVEEEFLAEAVYQAAGEYLEVGE
jgi:hypothetical protein